MASPDYNTTVTITINVLLNEIVLYIVLGDPRCFAGLTAHLLLQSKLGKH